MQRSGQSAHASMKGAIEVLNSRPRSTAPREVDSASARDGFTETPS